MVKYLLATAAFLIPLTGCIHTETIQTKNLSGEQSHELSQAMPGYVASLTFSDGSSVRGRSVRIAPDSVSWIDPDTQALHSRPLGTVRKVSYHDALKGARTGALVGAGTGIVIGLGWSAHDMMNTSTSSHVSPVTVAAGAAVIVGLPSLLAGGIVGAILGRREQYVFTRDANPRHRNSRPER